MTDKPTSSRRKFLSALSVGVTAGIAGCSSYLPGNNNNTATPKQAPNNTTLEPVERPEDGYLNESAGEVRWEEIDEDVEYIYAAQEAYGYAQEYLNTAFEHFETIFEEVLSEEPDYEVVDQRFTYAGNAVKAAGATHSVAIDLLNEHGGEQAALDAIQENNEEVVNGFKTLHENVGTLIEERKEDDRGYVAEHDEELLNRFESLKASNTPWRAIQPRINSPYYNNSPE